MSEALYVAVETTDDLVRRDYESMLAEAGMDEAYARTVSENEADQIPMPDGYRVTVAPSDIEGLGIFADKDFDPGEIVAPARIGGKRTPAGRYANHSPTPSARMEVLPNGDVDLIAVRGIAHGEEVTTDYRRTLEERARKSDLRETLEAEMLALEQVACPLVHHFGPGIYLREVTIPEGTLVVGHAHKFPHLCILMAGTLRVLNSEGEVRDWTAPAIFTAPTGRKVLYAVDGDCVFQNIFATEETDIDTLEARLVDKSPAYLAAEEARLLGVEP